MRREGKTTGEQGHADTRDHEGRQIEAEVDTDTETELETEVERQKPRKALRITFPIFPLPNQTPQSPLNSTFSLQILESLLPSSYNNLSFNWLVFSEILPLIIKELCPKYVQWQSLIVKSQEGCRNSESSAWPKAIDFGMGGAARRATITNRVP